MARRGAGGGGPPGRRGGRAGPARLAAREPVLHRDVRPHRLSHARPRRSPARVVRLERALAGPAAAPRDRRLAGDHPAAVVGRERGDPARAAALRLRASLRPRAPHGRRERLHAGGVGGDRAWHRALPRPRQRLERHRLQLSRRPLWPGLEGRYGGIARNVVGAHAEGFNTGSTGVALLGNYTSAVPTAAEHGALAAILAWRLDVAHVDPHSSVTAISGGNARYAAGVPVFLRAVSGHRDTGFTSCPGDALYRQINDLARATRDLGLPKLLAPTIHGKLGGP